MLRRPAFAELSARWQAAGEPGLLSELAAQLIAMGAKMVVLNWAIAGSTCGRLGTRRCRRWAGRARPGDPAAWADRELWAPCFQVEVVGTTGAGDATIAGFLCAFLRGRAPSSRLRLGWRSALAT